ncbi:MAG: hypothetical protein JWM14_1501 [Chitinophagaceae bacterium]|nr:hypothetical protein [Chitinophagaceae bacterium]
MLALAMIIISCSKKTDDPTPANNGSNPIDTSTHHPTPIPVTLKVFRDNDESFVSGGNLIYLNIKDSSQLGLVYQTSHGDNIIACGTTPDATFSLYRDSTYVFEYKITNSSNVTKMKLDIQVKITAANISSGCAYMIFNGFANSKYVESNLALKINKVMMPAQPGSVFINDDFFVDNNQGGSTVITYPTF